MLFKEVIKKFIPHSLLDWYYFSLALVGAFLYGFPSKKLVVVGVTGTNGKSTVVEMCDFILREAGYKNNERGQVPFLEMRGMRLQACR